MKVRDIHYKADNIFERAIKLGDRYGIRESKRILAEIIEKYSNDYDNMSAVYTTYCSVLLNDYISEPQKSKKNEGIFASKDCLRIIPKDVYEKLLKYNELATKERESNKVAHYQRLMIHLAYGNYKEATYQLRKLDVNQIENGLIWPYCAPDSLTNIILAMRDNNIYNKDLIEFMESVVERIPYNKILCALLNAYKMARTKDEIISALKFCESQVEKDPKVIVFYGETIGTIGIYIREYDKTIEYVGRLLEYYDNSEYIGLTKREIESEKDILKDLISTAYMEKGELDNSYEIRKSISKKYKNNTSMHNMGALLYKMGRSKEAIEYLKKALFIYEDETSYILLGDIYFALNDHKNALDCYSKSLIFIENNTKDFLAKDGSKMIYSMSFDESFKDTEITLYQNIIHCYIQLKDFNRANFYNDLALETFINESSFIKNRSLLELLVAQDESLKSKNSIIEDANNELNRLNQYANKMGKIREWALELMNIQDEIDIDNDWNKFEEKMVELAESIARNKKSNLEIKNVIKELKKKYYTLEDRTLNFLATAEFLYRTHSDEMIDYAPIVIEFSKVVELELNAILRKIDSFSEYLTIGQIRYNINKFENSYIYEIISDIIKIRNKSAHSGCCTKEDAEYIRSIIIDELLDKLVIMKRERKLSII